MKRVWFAVIFILLTTLACFYEQCYMKDFCKELTDYSETAIKAADNNDGKGYENSVERIKDCWKKRNDLAYCISNHVLLDELSFRINSAKYIKPSVYEIKAVIYAIYENSRIKLSNIF